MGERQLTPVPDHHHDHEQLDSSSWLLKRLLLAIDQVTDLYPAVEEYVGVRSNAGAGGSSGGLAVPVNLEMFAFVNELYWIGPKLAPGDDVPPPDDHVAAPPCAARRRTPGPRCGRCGGCTEAAAIDRCIKRNCGADPDNWGSGLKVTVFGLERSARIAFGFNQLERARPAGYDGHGVDDRVLDALRWLRGAAHTLSTDHQMLARTVMEELGRIGARCQGMVEGGRVQMDQSVNECPHCNLTSVYSDQTRAVCVTVYCRNADGSRRCWLLVGDVWTEVDEPDGRRGRGRNLSDERVAELVDEADALKKAAGAG